MAAETRKPITIARGRLTYASSGLLNFRLTKAYWTKMFEQAYKGQLGTLQFMPDPPKRGTR